MLDVSEQIRRWFDTKHRGDAGNRAIIKACAQSLTGKEIHQPAPLGVKSIEQRHGVKFILIDFKHIVGVAAAAAKIAARLKKRFDGGGVAIRRVNA